MNPFELNYDGALGLAPFRSTAFQALETRGRAARAPMGYGANAGWFDLAWHANFVPQGQTRIAQRFSVGSHLQKHPKLNHIRLEQWREAHVRNEAADVLRLTQVGNLRVRFLESVFTLPHPISSNELSHAK